jgi:ornithine cyclodeaminase/alanine dehydrogenase-like protein (mu-crystallin family)
MLESGDLLVPITEGKITADHIYAEIGEIASGETPGRTGDEEITLYKSMGLAIQDAAAANWFYEKARRVKQGFDKDL